MNSRQNNELVKNPFSGNNEAVKSGEIIFKQTCVMCHGEFGLGNGIAGQTLIKKPANLSSKRFQNQSDSRIFWKITNGYATMPSFEATLTEMQRWELVNYIRTLN